MSPLCHLKSFKVVDEYLKVQTGVETSFVEMIRRLEIYQKWAGVEEESCPMQELQDSTPLF